jgi:hypothetical protein
MTDNERALPEVPSATLLPSFPISWSDMVSLASSMVSSEAQRMLAMKTQQALSTAPRGRK